MNELTTRNETENIRITYTLKRACCTSV